MYHDLHTHHITLTREQLVPSSTSIAEEARMEQLAPFKEEWIQLEIFCHILKGDNYCDFLFTFQCIEPKWKRDLLLTEKNFLHISLWSSNGQIPSALTVHVIWRLHFRPVYEPNQNYSKIPILRPPLGLSKSGLKDHFWTVSKVVSNQRYTGCRKWRKE